MNNNYQYYKQRKIFKPIDFLIPVILIILVVFTIITMLTPAGDIAEIYLDGKLYGSYSLENDITIDIKIDEQINQIEIKSGQVQMVDANCKNGLCTYHSAIKNSREQIICAPHGLVVIIKNNKSDIDAITGGIQ